MLRDLQVGDDAAWKRRYRAPTVAWTQLAWHNPSRGLACSNQSGVFQLYAWDEPSGALTQLTSRKNGLVGGMLSPDSRFVYYLNDELGNELGHYVRIPIEGGEPEDITPDLPPYASLGIASSRSGNRLGFLRADDQGFHLCCIDVAEDGSLGPPRVLHHSKSMTVGPVFSYDGAIAVIGSTEGNTGLNFSLVALDATSGERIGHLTDGPDVSIELGSFAPRAGDDRLLAASNASGDQRPLVWNPCTGERTDLAVGQLAGEVSPVAWTPEAGSVLLSSMSQAVKRFSMYELATATLVPLEHPGGSYWATYIAPSGEIYTQWNDAGTPSRLVVLDPNTGAQRRSMLAPPDVPAGQPFRSVSFASSDGTMIQGWLGVPEGDGPFPTILDTHGGPTSVATEGFSANAQSWLDHGFAFLTINYRGSVTFGKAFEEQIWGDLGHWEVEDMVAAREWLVREGIASPDDILLTGWSYGGYLTLMGLGKRPELWAGGMAGIAIADWTIQYEDTADTLKGYQVALFGGTPEEKPEQYRASSPIAYVDQVKAPVLVIQGRNDTRCPARPMRMYEQRLSERGGDIEVHWFDAGHGSYDVEQTIEHQERMLRFAYRVLG